MMSLINPCTVTQQLISNTTSKCLLTDPTRKGTNSWDIMRIYNTSPKFKPVTCRYIYGFTASAFPGLMTFILSLTWIVDEVCRNHISNECQFLIFTPPNPAPKSSRALRKCRFKCLAATWLGVEASILQGPASLHNHPIGTWCRFNGIPVHSDHEVHGSSWDFQIFFALMSRWILWNPITSWYTIIETFRVTTSSTSKHRKSIGKRAFHVLVSAGFSRCLVTFAGPGGWKVVPSCSK